MQPTLLLFFFKENPPFTPNFISQLQLQHPDILYLSLPKSFRPYWRCYYSNTDAIIYVVDSADRDRMGISKQELVSMLEEEELRGAILVVLANKQDIEGAMSVTEVRKRLHCKK